MGRNVRRLTLTEAIESLRTDLEAAQRQGVGRTIGFSVQDISVELDVEAERTGNVEGGVSWYVTAKGGRAWTRRTATRLVVSLKPRGTLNVTDEAGRPRNSPAPRNSPVPHNSSAPHNSPTPPGSSLPRSADGSAR
ncbi:trypco2 family protein [Streptomyces sp. NPDC101175]|uniref:trypco2 family protein n=1 Tax=Streptomyces sp. NPDC101175 TaxID=3366123 RepID=UPI00383333BA